MLGVFQRCSVLLLAKSKVPLHPKSPLLLNEALLASDSGAPPDLESNHSGRPRC